MHAIISRPFKVFSPSSAMIGLMALGFSLGMSVAPMTTAEPHQSESESGKQHSYDSKPHHQKKHDKMRRVQAVINAYKLERGDISQAEIDAQMLTHQNQRAELKALKEAGDKKALKAKRKTMKTEFKAQHQETRRYVEAHPELKDKLHALRAEQNKGQRDHGKMKRMHRIVTDYKLKNGDITQAEVEQQKKEHHAKRKALHDYIEAHPDLQEQLKASRHEDKQHD